MLINKYTRPVNTTNDKEIIRRGDPHICISLAEKINVLTYMCIHHCVGLFF